MEDVMEKLVPSMASCLMIPSGAFQASAIVWNLTVADKETGELVGLHLRDDCEGWMRKNQIPAPTLEEVIACFPNHIFYICRSSGKWNVEAIDRLRMMPTAIGKSTVSSSDAALNVWLAMKGIKA